MPLSERPTITIELTSTSQLLDAVDSQSRYTGFTNSDLAKLVLSQRALKVKYLVDRLFKIVDGSIICTLRYKIVDVPKRLGGPEVHYYLDESPLTRESVVPVSAPVEAFSQLLQDVQTRAQDALRVGVSLVPMSHYLLNIRSLKPTTYTYIGRSIDSASEYLSELESWSSLMSFSNEG